LKQKTFPAQCALCMAAGLMFVMGLVYLFTHRIMPYHARFLGKTQAELEPGPRMLFMLAMRIIGGTYLAVSTGILMLAYRLGKGERWVRGPILAMSMISLAPSLFATLKVGHGAPWWLVTLDMTLFATAFMGSRS
jgi:hypothetical protein